MNHDDYVRVLREHGALLCGAARRGELDAPVPSCPRWTLADLLGHTGGHHRWVAANVARPLADGMVPFRETGRPPSGPAVVEWVEDGVEALARRLTETGPAHECWTWVDYDHTAGFWARRTAHETVVHAWDGQGAVGTPERIEPTLASDGIDEILSIAPFLFWNRAPAGTGETIHVHVTDTDGEWLLRLAPAGIDVERAHAKGDVALRGPAHDLYLVVLGRAEPEGAVEVIGDRAAFDTWREQFRF